MNIQIEDNKIFAPLKDEWLVLKPEEEVRQKYICRLVNNYEWGNMSADTYISVNGRHLKIVRAEGIGIAPQRTYFFNNEETFTLFFPPISAETSMISLMEPWRTDASALRIYGIKLQ